MNTGLKKLIGNTLWLLSERFLQLFIGFFISVWIARYFGPEKLGLYSYALAIVNLIASFAGLGLSSILVRDLARDPSSRDVTLGTALALTVLSRGFAAILAVAVILRLKPDSELAQFLVVIMAVGQFFLATEPISFWFYSQTRAKLASYVKNFAYLSVSLIKTILLIIHANLIAFAWAFLIENGLIAIGLIVTYHVDGNPLKRWKISINRARRLLIDCWPLMFSGALISIYMQIDQLMLGQMVDAHAVGLYSVVVKLCEQWYFIPMSIASSVFPSVVRSKDLGEIRYYQRLQNLFKLMVVIAYAAAILISLSANLFVPMLYGSDYIPIIPIMYIYVWSGVFVSLGIATNLWIVNEGFTQISFISSLGGVIINILLNYLLIPYYGIEGATIATVLSQFSASSLAYLAFLRTRKVFLMQMKAIFLPGFPNKRWFQ